MQRRDGRQLDLGPIEPVVQLFLVKRPPAPLSMPVKAYGPTVRIGWPPSSPHWGWGVDGAGFV